MLFDADSLEFSDMDKVKCNAESNLQLQMLVGSCVKTAWRRDDTGVNVFMLCVRLLREGRTLRGVSPAWVIFCKIDYFSVAVFCLPFSQK